MRVNFVIGGTQKGGTTALDRFLREHPEICLPDERKELHFFDREEEFRGRPKYKRYHANFRPQRGQHVLGEVTPIYMYWEPAPRRIWSYNPQMKWILILRDPVERAFSHWNMSRHRGKEALPFADAIAREAKRGREALPLQQRVHSYIDRGFYAHQVRRLFNIFGRENVVVLLTEDLRNDHRQTLRRVFQFLEVDLSFVPPARMVRQQQYDKIDKEMRARLIDVFRFDVKELERLIARDLSAWTK